MIKSFGLDRYLGTIFTHTVRFYPDHSLWSKDPDCENAQENAGPISQSIDISLCSSKALETYISLSDNVSFI